MNTFGDAAFRTRQVTATGAQWDGTDAGTDAVCAAAGALVVSDHGGRLWVDTEAGPAEVHPGWWVMRTGDGAVTVLSAEAHTRFWEPVP